MFHAPPSPWLSRAFPHGRRIDGRFAAGVRGDGNFLVPSLSITEADTGYLVVAEIPGAERDELHVTVSGRALCVRGQRRLRSETNGVAGNGPARYLSAFQREVQLAKAVDATRGEARFEHGVLTVTLPVVQGEPAREIPSRPIQVQ